MRICEICYIEGNITGVDDGCEKCEDDLCEKHLIYENDEYLCDECNLEKKNEE